MADAELLGLRGTKRTRLDSLAVLVMNLAASARQPRHNGWHEVRFQFACSLFMGHRKRRATHKAVPALLESTAVQPYRSRCCCLVAEVLRAFYCCSGQSLEMGTLFACFRLQPWGAYYAPRTSTTFTSTFTWIWKEFAFSYFHCILTGMFRTRSQPASISHCLAANKTKEKRRQPVCVYIS